MIIVLKNAQKRTWTIYFVYVLKASPNANHLKRVNVHALRRELSTSFLDDSINIGDILRTRIKSGCSSYISLCTYYVIRIVVLWVQHFMFIDCKNRKSFGNDKEIRENYGVGFSLFSLFFFVFSNKPLPYVDLDSSFCSFCGISKARFFTPLSRGRGPRPGRCGCKCSLRPAAG
jgi:hypothetical protein